MANSNEVNETLRKAIAAGNLEDVIVVGKDTDGKVSFYTDDVNRERMIALLERARNALVRSLDS